MMKQQSKKFFLIAGPCVIESEELTDYIARVLKEITNRLGIDFYFKASFDKANRTSMQSYRGPGIKVGLKILERIKQKYNVKIVTDIHEPWQAEMVKEVCEMIQIPAFLCRQTDLLVAAAKTDCIVNVKKAQFLAPWDMKYVADKLIKSGAKKICLCERGTIFGYNNLVVDMTAIVEMRKLGYPVVFDATHSVQKPSGGKDCTGGNREYVMPLACAAAAVGVDGFFMEVHPDPDKALSDGLNMVPLDQVEQLLQKLLGINECIK